MQKGVSKETILPRPGSGRARTLNDPIALLNLPQIDSQPPKKVLTFIRERRVGRTFAACGKKWLRIWSEKFASIFLKMKKT